MVHWVMIPVNSKGNILCRPHEAMSPSCQQGTVKAGGGFLKVCSIFTWFGLGSLICLIMLLTGDNGLWSFALTHTPMIHLFQQDDAPCHCCPIFLELV